MAQPTYSLRALVLRRTKLGESDLILTLLSEDGSQKRAVAKGARRPKSSFAARTEPFCVIDALCATGRSLDILKEARLVAAHDALRCNLEASAAAAPVAELLARMSQRDLANPRLFQSAMRVLDAMDGVDDNHCAALSAAELLKILAFSGLRPSLEVCVGCGEPVALTEGAASRSRLQAAACSARAAGVWTNPCLWMPAPSAGRSTSSQPPSTPLPKGRPTFRPPSPSCTSCRISPAPTSAAR